MRYINNDRWKLQSIIGVIDFQACVFRSAGLFLYKGTCRNAGARGAERERKKEIVKAGREEAHQRKRGF